MTKLDRDGIRARVAVLLHHAGDAQAIDHGLQPKLSSLGSEEQPAAARRFIKGMGELYGAAVPALRIIAADLDKWGQSQPDPVCAMVDRMWHKGSRDDRVIAAKVLERLGTRKWERTLEVATSFV
ncbi:MAG: DNA alkylation repair protein, partial [Chloroflexota bacterium]